MLYFSDIDDCDPGNFENAIEGVGVVTEFGYCGRNGKCIDGIATYNCSCNKGWTGKACEVDINECESMPCKNGGECFQTINADFRCACRSGFTGKDCSASKHVLMCHTHSWKSLKTVVKAFRTNVISRRAKVFFKVILINHRDK